MSIVHTRKLVKFLVRVRVSVYILLGIGQACSQVFSLGGGGGGGGGRFEK